MYKFESCCVKYYKPANVQTTDQVTDTKFGPKSVVYTNQNIQFKI